MSGERHGSGRTQDSGHTHGESHGLEWVELGIATGTLLIGALALVAGTFDPLWDWLGVGKDDSELRGLLSVGLSVFVLLAGFLGLVWLQSARTLKKVSHDVSLIVDRVRSHVPSFASAEIVSKESAFKELDLLLQLASRAWNTRLGTGHTPTRYSTPAAQKYIKRIATELARGLTFIDVAAATFEPDAQTLMAMANKSQKGKYECLLYNGTGPGYINFIVVEFKDGSYLTFCGWSATIAPGGDKSVLRFRDETVARFFREWHNGLASAADRRVQ